MMFSHTDRDIYGPYWNGTAEVYGDPIAIERRLSHALGMDPEGVLQSAKSPIEPIAFEATEKLLKAIPFGFASALFDPATGQGLTEAQALALLKDYVAWREKKNLIGATTPTLPQSTDCPPAS